MRIAAASLGTPSTMGAAGYHSVSLASSVYERNAGGSLVRRIARKQKRLNKKWIRVLGVPRMLSFPVWESASFVCGFNQESEPRKIEGGMIDVSGDKSTEIYKDFCIR
jgi:hypothetical protein